MLCLLSAFYLSACALPDRVSVEEPLYPAPAPAEIDWYEILSTTLEPLDHERGRRWPLVLWHGVGYEPLERDRIESLLDRGVVQHLRLGTPDIPAARALTAAGAPVVLMEGAGGAWPYDTVADDEAWRLRFPDQAEVLPGWSDLPDPTRLDGWEQAASLTRERLRRYKSQDIQVDGVWLDYEGALLHDDYAAVRSSTAARLLPQAVMDDERRYRRYRRAHWLHRLSRYLAAPVRRVYPNASVTNWVVMQSSADHPVRSWTGWLHPPSPPLFFTHTNPIAYGIDTYFLHQWPPDLEINRRNVDRFFTHVLLRQVSVDAYNRMRQRPDVGAVVWVSRWVPDHPERKVPVMSRAAYREALRHIWLRGADAMQIFNPPRKGYERHAIHEVEDVQRVYDEMLEYRDFLERGEIMNLEVPNNRDASVMWSGLRLGSRAVVRITNLGVEQNMMYVCLTEEYCADFHLPRHGRTFVLDLTQ